MCYCIVAICMAARPWYDGVSRRRSPRPDLLPLASFASEAFAAGV